MGNDARVEDLQSVSKQILVEVERIESLELEKRRTLPGSVRFQELSDEIERLAEEMRLTSHAETNLAQELQGETGLPTVEEADAGS